jgi:hypothetical protein
MDASSNLGPGIWDAADKYDKYGTWYCTACPSMNVTRVLVLVGVEDVVSSSGVAFDSLGMVRTYSFMPRMPDHVIQGVTHSTRPDHARGHGCNGVWRVRDSVKKT